MVSRFQSSVSKNCERNEILLVPWPSPWIEPAACGPAAARMVGPTCQAGHAWPTASASSYASLVCRRAHVHELVPRGGRALGARQRAASAAPPRPQGVGCRYARHAGCVGIGRDPRACSDPSLTFVLARVHRCRRVVVPELSGEAARPRAAGRAAGEAERAPRAARRRGRPTPTPRSTRATRGGLGLGSRQAGYGRARGAPWTSNPKPGPELTHLLQPR